jgi:hypothetical protein
MWSNDSNLLKKIKKSTILIIVIHIFKLNIFKSKSLHDFDKLKRKLESDICFGSQNYILTLLV